MAYLKVQYVDSKNKQHFVDDVEDIVIHSGTKVFLECSDAHIRVQVHESWNNHNVVKLLDAIRGDIEYGHSYVWDLCSLAGERKGRFEHPSI